MKDLQIIIRKDINMRKGKMAAQAGHAAMKVLINSMQMKNNRLSINEKNLKLLRAFIKDPKVEIQFASDEEALASSLKLTGSEAVIDNGATVFNGVKTATCGASGIFAESWQRTDYSGTQESNDFKARQYFIYSKRNSLSQESACVLAAIGCLAQLEKMLVEENSGASIYADTNIAFYSWINDDYSKVALCVPTDLDLLKLEMELQIHGSTTSLIKLNGNMMLAVGPEYISNIEEYVRDLKLLR